MSDLPDFLSDEPSSAPETAPVSEPAAPPAPQPTPEPAAEGPPRGPDGRFAPAEATPPDQPAQPTPDPLPHAPLAALLDEREKRQQAEARATQAEKDARELREWREQQEAERNRRPPPSRDEDPDAYEAYRHAVIDTQMFVQRRDFSREIATIKHGEQVVNAAWQWAYDVCERDPHFNDKVRNSANPAEFVVAEWRRDQVASKVDPNDYEAFLAWKAGGGASPAPATPAAPPATPAPVAPRPSLAGGPSAASSASAIPRDGAATFDAMFGH